MGKTKELLADTRYWADELQEKQMLDLDVDYIQEVKKELINKLSSKFKVKSDDK